LNARYLSRSVGLVDKSRKVGERKRLVCSLRCREVIKTGFSSKIEKPRSSLSLNKLTLLVSCPSILWNTSFDAITQSVPRDGWSVNVPLSIYLSVLLNLGVYFVDIYLHIKFFDIIRHRIFGRTQIPNAKFEI